MKKMTIRHTENRDKETLLSIYENARQFMAASGNPNQWDPEYPSLKILEGDMALNQSYVCEEDGKILATFMLSLDPDPTYQVIEGAWLNDRPYATLHRVASAGIRGGMMKIIVPWAFEICPNLRADTHECNRTMRRALEECGFQECGVIHLLDMQPRLAYQKEK